MSEEKNGKSWSLLRQQLLKSKVKTAFENQNYVINGRHYRGLRCIGHGGYSKVYDIFDSENTLLALKVATSNHSVSEISCLQLLNKVERVIQLLDYEFIDSTLYAVFERGEIDLGNLLNGLKNKKNVLTASQVKFYWEQMLEAVKGVHALNIIHGDLKPSNFLFVHGVLKIIDFGLAHIIPVGETGIKKSRVSGGTKEYMSPELFAHVVIEEGSLNMDAMKEKKKLYFIIQLTSDVWSLGVILYNLIYDVMPFSDMPGGKVAKMQCLIDPDFPVSFPPLSNPHLLDTLKRSLKKNPKDRPSVDELLSHPYLQI